MACAYQRLEELRHRDEGRPAPRIEVVFLAASCSATLPRETLAAVTSLLPSVKANRGAGGVSERDQRAAAVGGHAGRAVSAHALGTGRRGLFQRTHARVGLPGLHHPEAGEIGKVRGETILRASRAPKGSGRNPTRFFEEIETDKNKNPASPTSQGEKPGAWGGESETSTRASRTKRKFMKPRTPKSRPGELVRSTVRISRGARQVDLPVWVASGRQPWATALPDAGIHGDEVHAIALVYPFGGT